MKDQAYHFGFCVDANYVKYAGVLMTNILIQHLGQPVCFHLACDGLDDDDKRRLDMFTAMYRNVNIFVYNMTSTLDKLKPLNSAAPNRLHRAALLRIILPSLLHQSINRLVYMDVDMLCIKRMDELWQLDMGKTAVAAVMDALHIKRARSIGLQHDRYLADGMLVINLPVWRANNLSKRMIECYQQHADEFTMPDQDAINVVLNGDFIALDDKFSYLVEVNNPLMIKFETDTVALHFVNEAKPWTKGCVPTIYDMYWDYVRRSLWSDMQQVEPATIKSAFLAATTAELHGDYREATKYYGLVARRLTEYYLEQNRADVFEENI